MGKIIANGQRPMHPKRGAWHCSHPGCFYMPAPEFENFGLCREHVTALLAAAAPTQPATEGFDKVAATRLVRSILGTGKVDSEAGVVYYVALGKHIKIGTTTNLHHRLQQFRNTIPTVQLLATEPGGRSVERRRHEQFAASRIDPKRELFTPTKELTDHIRNLAREAA